MIRRAVPRATRAATRAREAGEAFLTALVGRLGFIGG
jgi:hypothetical protein